MTIRQIPIGDAIGDVTEHLLLTQLKESARRVARIPIQGTRPSDYEAAAGVTDAIFDYAIQMLQDVVRPLEENGPRCDLPYFIQALKDLKADTRSTLEARAEGAVW
jgi:hypothetical protein